MFVCYHEDHVTACVEFDTFHLVPEAESLFHIFTLVGPAAPAHSREEGLREIGAGFAALS